MATGTWTVQRCPCRQLKCWNGDRDMSPLQMMIGSCRHFNWRQGPLHCFFTDYFRAHILWINRNNIRRNVVIYFMDKSHWHYKPFTIKSLPSFSTNQSDITKHWPPHISTGRTFPMAVISTFVMWTASSGAVGWDPCNDICTADVSFVLWISGGYFLKVCLDSLQMEHFFVRHSTFALSISSLIRRTCHWPTFSFSLSMPTTQISYFRVAWLVKWPITP